jgi:glycosyltransferase involved in cell wall biosynthesis
VSGRIRVALHTGQLDRPVPGGIGRYVEGLLAHLPDGGVAVERFGGGRWRYEAWHRLRRPVVRTGGDVVHAPSLAVPPAGRRPLVVTVHDLAFRTHPDCFPARGRAFHERGLALARDEAAAVIVPSEATAGEVRAAGFEAGRVHVAHHGIDVPPATTSAAPAGPAPAVLGLAAGSYVLFVGTIEPRKGVDVLLAAHAALRRHRRPGLHLVVAGPPGWGPTPALDGPGVLAPGRVDEPTLDALYRGAAALAVPSRSEGFGLPALEAMARGCPVVASDAGALPEVVGDAGLLVRPGDPDALAGALDRILRDDSLAAALAAAGRARAATFTWSACIAAHVDAYRAALGLPTESSRRSSPPEDGGRERRNGVVEVPAPAPPGDGGSGDPS